MKKHLLRIFFGAVFLITQICFTGCQLLIDLIFPTETTTDSDIVELNVSYVDGWKNLANRPEPYQTETYSDPDYDSSNKYTTVTEESVQNWTYSAAEPYFEVNKNATTLNLSSLPATSKVYLIRTNPHDSVVSTSYMTKVSANMAAYSDSNSDLYSDEEADTETDSDETELNTEASNDTSRAVSQTADNNSDQITGKDRHFTAPRIHTTDSSFISKEEVVFYEDQDRKVQNANDTFVVGQKVEKINASVGTRKKIYIDGDENLSTFKLANATLRAVGKYCYVWVVDGFYESDGAGLYSYARTYSSGSTYETTDDEIISKASVETIASTFDRIYPAVRNIYGKESDEIRYRYDPTQGKTHWYLYDMDYLSDTGTMVNIVIYDIGNDHQNDDYSGVMGYFYSKDYYPNGSHIPYLGEGLYYSSSSPLNQSNEGKYFYVDAYYACDDLNESLSTLAHEFQHMVDFGVKELGQGLYSSRQYDEMLSMLCEDVMQDLLGINEQDGPIARLPTFNKNYYKLGFEWDESSLGYESYANNYAFGAWLIRKYGGVPLLHEIATNKHIDVNSILLAVNTINGTSLKMEDICREFAFDCLVDNGVWNFGGTKTLTSSSSLYCTEADYGYPVHSINLWNLDKQLYGTTLSESSYLKYKGLSIFTNSSMTSLRPFGMFITTRKSLEYGTSRTINLSYGTNVNRSNNEKLYVYVK